MGQNNNNTNRCFISLPSVTYAMKAERLLSDRMIRAEAVRGDSRRSQGCGFGLRLDCRDADAAVRILRNAGISAHVKEI